MGFLGNLVGCGAVNHLAAHVGIQARTNIDIVGEHRHRRTGGIDVQLFNVPLSGHVGSYIQIQFLDLGVPVQLNSGVNRRFVHSELLYRPFGHQHSRTGGLVDHILNPAGQVQTDTAASLQRNVHQTLVIGVVILQVGRGADNGVGDFRDTVRPDGDGLIPHVVHQHLLGFHVAHDHAGIAAFAFAGTADDNPPQYLHVLQFYAAQAHAAGDEEVSADGGIPQGDVGGGDGHIAKDSAQGVSTAPVEGLAHALRHQGGHLSLRDCVLRTKCIIGVAGDDVIIHSGLYQTAGPAAHVASVTEGQTLAWGLFHHHVAPQDAHRHLSGQLFIWGGRCVRGARHITGGVGDANIVIEPIGYSHIGKGNRSRLGIAVGTVDNGREIGPGDRRVRVSGLVGAHHTPIHQLVQIGVRPVGGGGAGGQDRRHPQQHDSTQQQGKRPLLPGIDLGSGSARHSGSPFFFGALHGPGHARACRFGYTTLSI